VNTPEQRDVLSPEELSRLLRAAVEPIRPSPEAYQRIRAGVERRHRWRAPLFAASGVVLAAAVVLSVLLLRPRQQPHTIDVLPPASLPVGSQTVAVTGGQHPSTPPGGVHTSAGPGGSTATDTGPSGSTTRPVTTPASPSTPGASRSDGDSLTRPTPVRSPAIDGDIDGDGIVDTVRASGASVQVDLSRGGTATLSLPAGSTAGQSTAVDLNDDGFAELVIQTGSSDGIAYYTVADYLAPKTMALLTLPSSQRLEAGMSGTTDGWGFTCANTGLQLVRGTSSDNGETYQVTTTTLLPTLDGWTQQGTPSTTTQTGSAATPSFAAHCGSLR
jgi:hypothetical protein